MYILAVDTSCDDTSVAVLRNDNVLANIVSSQIDLHKEWGGVVPNIARREHQINLPICISKALKRAKLDIEDIDVIAVTFGPGLAPALEVGLSYTKDLAKKYNKKLVAINHMEGHLLSSFLKSKHDRFYCEQLSRLEKKDIFPFLTLLISGGHTEIIYVEEIGKYQKIGSTRDDAVGEVYDKIARALGLGYPGGPIVNLLAEKGDKNKIDFPRPMLHSKDYDFSFSGLKTSVVYKIRDTGGFEKITKESDPNIYDFCASFENAVIDTLAKKLSKAVVEYSPKLITIGGGVASNLTIRRELRRRLKLPILVPPKKFCTDNASMIGIVGYYKVLRGEFVLDIDGLDRLPSLTF